MDIDDSLPASVAVELRVVPLCLLAGTLIVATDSHSLNELRDRVACILNRKVHVVTRSSEWLEKELDSRYRFSDEYDDNSTENYSTCWYWPSWHWFDGDKLVVKASGWDGTTHWTGAQEFPPDHPDREFWNWLVRIPHYHGLLDEVEIPKIKRVWNRYLRRTMQATNRPLDRSGGSATS